jgi:Rrf2 family protein
MKITAQEEYGLRCLLAVARQTGSTRLLAIREIARGEALSPQYVAKLMNMLRRHGLVESVRGLLGGFRLARPAHQISAMEALLALGGGFEVASDHLCTHFTGKQTECIHLPGCSLRPLWGTMLAHISEFLTHMTLADLLHEEPTAKKQMTRQMQRIAEAS